MSEIKPAAWIVPDALAELGKHPTATAGVWSGKASHELIAGAAPLYSIDTLKPLIDAMEGIDHFKDALNWREDHLSRALRQWIEAGSDALADLQEMGQ